MDRIFRNPVNGHTESVSGASGFFMFLFGVFYLAYKGLWSHFFIWIILVGGFSVLTGGPGAVIALPIATLAYSCTIKGILVNSYLRQGWEEVHNVTDKSVDQPILSVIGQRECPYCAEMIKAQAIKCKHCGSEVPPLEQQAASIPVTQGNKWFVTIPFASNRECREITEKVRGLGHEVPSETSKHIRVGPYPTEAYAVDILQQLTTNHNLQGGLEEVGSSR